MESDYKNFRELSVEEIDNRLEVDIEENKKKIKKITIISFFVLVFLFRGSIARWARFSVAISRGISNERIDTSKEPIQTDYSKEEQKEKTFVYHSLINKNEMEIIPQAHYILSAKMVASNHSFIFVSKFFDSAALYDLGSAWGKMADKKLYKKYVKVYSAKTELTGARRLHWQWRHDTPVPSGYISSHLSHTHIIPANRNIMAAMLKNKMYQDFRLESELVDMNYYDKNIGRVMHYKTSLSRRDTDASSRGSGACETMYVTKVQIGNKVYK